MASIDIISTMNSIFDKLQEDILRLQKEENFKINLEEKLVNVRLTVLSIAAMNSLNSSVLQDTTTLNIEVDENGVIRMDDF